MLLYTIIRRLVSYTSKSFINLKGLYIEYILITFKISNRTVSY